MLGGAAALALTDGAWAADGAFARLAALERKSGGRLGVYARRRGGRSLAHRADERFAMASTFKASLAAAVLQRVDRGQERLDRVVRISKADILPTSPVSAAHLAAGGASVETLAEAIVKVSDNAAANLLLASVGGPAGLTRFWRSIGDTITRLDRPEMALNSALRGDPRDTTSPAAMAANLDRFLFGTVLSAASQRRLGEWLAGVTTGLTMLRTAAPADWRAGDKTGRGQNNTTNDIAVFWPPMGEPIVCAVYLTEARLELEGREGIIAEAGRIIVAELAGGVG